MSSIEYTEENIDQILDLIGEAYKGCMIELDVFALRDANINYDIYIKKINSKWHKFLKFSKNPFNYTEEIPVSYDDYASEMYERSIKYYSQGRLERINNINELALQAYLSKSKFILSGKDHEFLLNFI